MSNLAKGGGFEASFAMNVHLHSRAQHSSTLMVTGGLWTYKRIAQYLDCAVGTVVNYYTKRPDFPKAIRIGSNNASPRYESDEVSQWARSFKEKSA